MPGACVGHFPQPELKAERSGHQDQAPDDDEGVFLPADVDETHHGHDKEGDEGQGDDRQEEIDKDGRDPVGEARPGMDAVSDEHRHDDRRGGQVFIDDDDREFRKQDLGRGDREGDEEIQVTGKIKGREDVVKAEDEDQELPGEQAEGKEGALLSEGSERGRT